MELTFTRQRIAPPRKKRLGEWMSGSEQLALGTALPTLPLWLASNFSVPLDLESTYEETCQVLRIR